MKAASTVSAFLWTTLVMVGAAAGSPLEQALQRESEATVRAFNAGDAVGLGSMFLETGELVDEAGTVHAGKRAITDLFTGFFERFPKSTLEMVVTSSRLIGETLAVEEGERRITTADGETAQVRYVTVRSKQGDRWPIASYHEFSDDPLPSPREVLQSVSWLVGDWVDESPTGRAAISFRWSDDGNFLLGDYTMSAAGAGESKSVQRIGWDPVVGQLRSWTFDSDGGFTEGRWDVTDEGWVVKSDATMPDGTTGSATLVISVKDADHFVVRGTDRIVGGVEQPDFEVTVSRRSPRPGGGGRPAMARPAGGMARPAGGMARPSGGIARPAAPVARPQMPKPQARPQARPHLQRPAAPLNAVAPGGDWTTMSSLYGSVDAYTEQLRKLGEFCRSKPDNAAGPETDLVGRWAATSGKDSVELVITDDSRFTWKAASAGRPPVEIAGTIETARDAIALVSEAAFRGDHQRHATVVFDATEHPDAFRLVHGLEFCDLAPPLLGRQQRQFLFRGIEPKERGSLLVAEIGRADRAIFVHGDG